ICNTDVKVDTRGQMVYCESLGGNTVIVSGFFLTLTETGPCYFKLILEETLTRRVPVRTQQRDIPGVSISKYDEPITGPRYFKLILEETDQACVQ
ncbi:hypothetical protein AVEN_35430-1, partial [Araneus ventricosus]